MKLYRDDENTAIYVAEEAGNVLGAAAYSESEETGVLEYIEVFSEYQDRDVASSLMDFLMENTDVETLYAYATSMNGKVQHMIQDRGFEASGFDTGPVVSDVRSEAGGGFNLNLWKIDEEIEAYIPEELREFTEASLCNAREINYRKPENSEIRGSFGAGKIEGGGGKETGFMSLEVGEGETTVDQIEEEIASLNTEEFWATEANLDTSEPVAYPISRELYSQGFRPIDLSPEIKGQRLKMMDLKVKAGNYRIIPETQELLEKTGLNFEVVEEGEQSDAVNILPGTQ
ncbi:MAG: GNAT family N-acetyltransferase [Candidatus Nanohaloarchaea archaeon]